MNSLHDYIKMYVEWTKTNGAATESGDLKLTNKSYDNAIEALNGILKYGKSGRDEILLLLEYDDISVQCWAAADSLKYNEKLALEKLYQISKQEKGIIRFNAEMIIEQWLKGNLEVP